MMSAEVICAVSVCVCVCVCVCVSVQLEPGAAAQVAAHTAAMAGRAAEGAGVACQASVHRCLIYLGDLYRYLSQVCTHTRTDTHTRTGRQEARQMSRGAFPRAPG